MAAVRVSVLRRESDASATELDGLRNASANALRAAASDLATCNRVAAAYGVVVNEAGAFAQDVARDADQCHSDIQTLKEAWPR